jgi:hypothetical protein
VVIGVTHANEVARNPVLLMLLGPSSHSDQGGLVTMPKLVIEFLSGASSTKSCRG